MGAEGTVAAGVVRAQLARVGRRVWLGQLVAGACWWLATIGAAALVLCLGDNCLHLPAAVRLVGSLGLLAAAAHEGWRLVVVPWRSRWTPERAARAIESAQARVDNLLLNACQLEAMPLAEAERQLAAPVITGARALLLGVRAGALVRLRRLLLISLSAGAVVALWGGYRAAAPERLGNALERFALPLADVPPLGSVDIALEPARDTVLSEGGALEVRVAVRARGAGTTPEAPRLAWQEGASAVAPDGSGGEFVALAPAPGRTGVWIARFQNLHRSFAIRALCGDSATPSVLITVAPLPRLVRAQVSVREPAYAGGAVHAMPGPPAAIAALIGSELSLSLELDRPVDGLAWRTPAGEARLSGGLTRWLGRAQLAGSGDGDLVLGDGRVLAHAGLVALPDAPPEAALEGVDENRLLLPGSTLAVGCHASDDHGLAECALVVREGEDGAPTVVARWSYLGPPGPVAASERATLVLDPARFLPGHTYVLEAQARDRCPPGQLGRSRPVLLRIRDLRAIMPADARLGRAVGLLKKAIACERLASGQSDNLAPALAEAISGGRLREHAAAIAGVQAEARGAAGEAAQAFAHEGDQADSRALGPLVDGEMLLVAADLDALGAAGPGSAPSAQALLARIERRQRAILEALIAILGESAARPDPRATPPPIQAEAQERADGRDAVARARDDLKDFLREQERIVARSKTLAEVKPVDLSDGQSQAVGALARDEASQAKFLEDKMSDFSKLPTEDFSDATLGKEINQVWQDITEADESLYKKSVQMAVPQEQNGLELAKELENNLEKWMANHRDNVQWAMEEALKPSDVPISELPKQLEDIVGDLLDKEDKMSPEVEDLSSAWMDNIDKGAGWDAADGPISNMSAKGITGNQLPNQDEIGGRSGEGRNGRSSGQMVEETAQGKGGRETPSRLEPEPFESGSVKDSDTTDHGGPTGGGKVSGAAAEGLRGPVPPPLAHAMARLAGQQANIRQQAGALALELRRRHLPSGDVENAVQAMQGIERAAASAQIGGIRQRYAEAVDALRAAREGASAAPAAVRRERIDLDRTRRDLTQGEREGVPAGYEEMSSAYFRALAEAPK